MFLAYIWLACCGTSAGRFVGPRIVTPCATTVSSGLGQFAVAAPLGRQIDDHRARRHLGDHLGRDQDRRLLAGHGRGGDDDVALGDHAGHQLALAAVELLVHLLGVAALGFGRGGLQRHLDELAPRLCTCSLTAGRTS